MAVVGGEVAITGLRIGCDETLTWSGATVTVAGSASYLNAATVTYAIKDAAGTAVTGATGTLAYVAASSGNYEGTLESSVLTAANFTEGAAYLVEFTLVSGSYNGFRRLVCRAAYRGED